MLFRLALFASLLIHSTSILADEVAKGTVYHDANWNKKFDADDKPLAGVRVSNGQQIVRTDKDGRYTLPVSDDTILFVVKPRNWKTPIDKLQLPRFYYIHKPQGSPLLKFAGVEPTGDLPESIDFPLYPQDEPDQFKAILFGDPQPRDQKEVDYISHDVVEELVGTDASFGVTLGDIVFDDLDIFKPLTQSIALLGIPWYNVIGNHDINYDAKTDRHSDETFERTFGPAYYSFDYGTVHFVVVDDVEWYIPNGGTRGRYRGGLGKEQMAFIKNDLAMIPQDQLVVLMMHIPLVDVHDRQELYRLIEKRPFCISVSGHTHYHAHRYITKADGWQGPKPHHHIINVTVSGSWWSGTPDERGIPHTMMRDGAPNGYSIISFDGQKYSLDFKAAGRSADYQMSIRTPEEVTTDQLAETIVFANVFNASEKSKVEFTVGQDAPWQEMQRVVQNAPGFMDVVRKEASIKDKTWRNLPKPSPSSHLWRATLPAGISPGTQLLRVRSTDPDGRTVKGQRTIRVRAAEAGAAEAKSAEAGQ